MNFPNPELEELKKELQASFELLQQQLAIIERQLDGITVLANRTFTASLSPQSRQAERDRAIALAGRIAQEAEDKINAELKSRSARGVPDDGDAVTPDDIQRAENENLLT